MKYSPKEFKENVNVSRAAPLKDFFELILKILGSLFLIYIFLGFAADYLASHMSIGTELKLSRLFVRELEEGDSKDSDKARAILEKLVSNAENLPKFNYKIYVLESKEINALALPAGNIAVFTGLLKEVGSDNELAMVLAHELGHYVHRDHLRGMGRSFVFLVLSSVLFGADNAVSKFITNSLMAAQMKFSQHQERAADLYALDLLNETYGNVGGALDFFSRMSKKERLPVFLHFFSTHPYSGSRLISLKERIVNKGYRM